MSYVREINDPAELEEIRLTWASLLPQTPGASFFHSLDWLLVYWNHFGHNQRLRVLVVSALGKPLGILPLAVRTETNRAGSLRVLTYPLDNWGSFYGPIGPNPTATLVAGLQHVQTTPPDWDVLDLRFIQRRAFDRGRSATAMQIGGFPGVWQTGEENSWIELRGGWEAYWSSRKSEWRNNVRRCEKRVARQGLVEHIRYRPRGLALGEGDPRWDWYDACEQLAARSWQGSSRTGTTLSHESIKEYLRDTHQRAAECGAVDMNLLLVSGQPAAFAYAYQYQGYVYGMRMGYDAAVSTEGTGTVLQHRIIRDCFERGDWLYDLGPDSSPLKRYWRTSLETSHRYTHYRPNSLRAQLLRSKRGLQNWLNQFRPSLRPAAGDRALRAGDSR
ncbi:MAG TPA: GNAT family N-acetyltransferase [Pirellulales bacterium]|jgi:CelD/BcsL family acetyltransferase involved in cellulose biosynthesis|nr:GNAT family N-acetyltransferase [Pirellulales bacterium]